MIRINLLPIRRAKRQEAGQRQFLAMGLAILGTIGLVVFFHLQATTELEKAQHDNTMLQADVAKLKSELGDYDKVRAQREELLRQRKTIQSLESGRTGPVYLLRELSEILSPGKGPTFDRVTYEEALRKDPNAGFGGNWEPKRAWIDSYQEDRLLVRLRGSAKSNEDVAEFLKRLNASVFFKNVNLDATAQASKGVVKFVNFGLTTTVVY
ncbi:MAG: PilN domain-containing protein [Deltaproteobacteria bacterium]|nr:PilN domain-containing protein [Deltaproteobacteria bacterium]